MTTFPVPRCHRCDRYLISGDVSLPHKCDHGCRCVAHDDPRACPVCKRFKERQTTMPGTEPVPEPSKPDEPDEARGGASFHTGKSKQNQETPWEFINAVEKRFGKITFDLAADEHNHRHSSYFSEQDDSFAQAWHKIDGLLWLNPPFRRIAPWVAKCASEKVLGAKIALLVPAAVGSNWFADHVHEKALVLPFRPRLSFDGKNPYPKDLLLAVYGLPPCFELWRWK